METTILENIALTLWSDWNWENSHNYVSLSGKVMQLHLLNSKEFLYNVMSYEKSWHICVLKALTTINTFTKNKKVSVVIPFGTLQ